MIASLINSASNISSTAGKDLKDEILKNDTDSFKWQYPWILKRVKGMVKVAFTFHIFVAI